MIASAQALRSEATQLALPTSRPRLTAGDTLDEALIERIAAGERAAMNILYTRHSVRVFRFILRFVDNEAAAEELVNGVFLDVWRNAGKFEHRSQVSTWLLALARHQALGTLRRRSTESLDNDAVALIEDPADNAEAIVDKKKTSSILRNCLAQLSPLHRETIDLVYYHGKTISDAAAIIGIKQSTVKTRMFYARRRLAELLRAQGIVAASA
jgi:RNA polymerase sigma-70 factor (ECF subfamily)